MTTTNTKGGFNRQTTYRENIHSSVSNWDLYQPARMTRDIKLRGVQRTSRWQRRDHIQRGRQSRCRETALLNDELAHLAILEAYKAELHRMEETTRILEEALQTVKAHTEELSEMSHVFYNLMVKYDILLQKDAEAEERKVRLEAEIRLVRENATEHEAG